MTLLQTKKLTKRFGGVTAVDAVDFDIASKGVHALIGPNGAGKTTFVSLLAGRLIGDSGSILFDKQDITKVPAHRRVDIGLGYTFQITSIFPSLSLYDNLALALRDQPKTTQGVRESLDAVGLEVSQHELAGNLSYGHQRLLELAMGMALQPKLLMLDEPTQGMASDEVAHVSSIIRDLGKQISVLLIEHNMDVVMNTASQITVLNTGQILATGSPEEIQTNQAVQEAYLGA